MGTSTGMKKTKVRKEKRAIQSRALKYTFLRTIGSLRTKKRLTNHGDSLHQDCFCHQNYHIFKYYSQTPNLDSNMKFNGVYMLISLRLMLKLCIWRLSKNIFKNVKFSMLFCLFLQIINMIERHIQGYTSHTSDW